MTTNPLARRREEPANDSALRPITRTGRDYVYDLCDAYNANMSQAARERGAQWYVAPSGELKLGDHPEWARHNRREIAARMETERTRYIRHQLENARADRREG